MIAALAWIWKVVFFAVNGIRDGARWCKDHVQAALGIALAIVILLAVLFATCAARRGNTIDDLQKKLGQAAERSDAHAAGLPIADPVDSKRLVRERNDARRDNAILAEQLGKAEAELGHLRPLVLVHGSTGMITAHGKPHVRRDTNPKVEDPIDSPSGIPTPIQPGRTLLAEGDKAAISTDIAIDQTDKRNVVVTVVSIATRFEPLPAEDILAGEIKKATIHVDPDVLNVPGPTVTKTRWWLVGTGVATGVVLGFCAANQNHCGIGK